MRHRRKDRKTEKEGSRDRVKGVIEEKKYTNKKRNIEKGRNRRREREMEEKRGTETGEGGEERDREGGEEEKRDR